MKIKSTVEGNVTSTNAHYAYDGTEKHKKREATELLCGDHRKQLQPHWDSRCSMSDKYYWQATPAIHHDPKQQKISRNDDPEGQALPDSQTIIHSHACTVTFKNTSNEHEVQKIRHCSSTRFWRCDKSCNCTRPPITTSATSRSD